MSRAASSNDLARAAVWNAFAKAGGLQDQGLDVATANLTAEERTASPRSFATAGF